MIARCRVALLGFGTVGSAVARRLIHPDAGASGHGLELTHIFDRRASTKCAAHPQVARPFQGRDRGPDEFRNPRSAVRRNPRSPIRSNADRR